MTLHSKAGEISGRNFMMRFCRGTLVNPFAALGLHYTPFCIRALFRADFWGGDATKHFSVKKRVFSEKGGGNSLNGGFGKDFYRKSNSVKRSGRFSEPPDSEKLKVAVLIPFPKSNSYLCATKVGVPNACRCSACLATMECASHPKD